MKCRLPLKASKKIKASDNNGIRVEEDCTPETWRGIRIKVGQNTHMWRSQRTDHNHGTGGWADGTSAPDCEDAHSRVTKR